MKRALRRIVNQRVDVLDAERGRQQHRFAREPARRVSRRGAGEQPL
jgi:hypothetical protein